MKEKKIKSLTEYFAQSFDGDPYNGSNGVFKINYRAYDDLSIPTGRGPDPSLAIKDSSFRIGDIVKGRISRSKKNVNGEIIKIDKSQDGKFYIIKVQSLKTKKSFTLVPGSIENLQDRGYTTDQTNVNITARQRNAAALKYNGGNVVWGSLEGRHIDSLFTDIDNLETPIDGPMETGWKIKFVDTLPQGKVPFNSFVIDPIESLIYSLREKDIETLKVRLKAIESHSFIFYHPDLKDYPEELRCLVSIIFLEMKNEIDAKKFLIENFAEITGRSYGEVRDEQFNDAKEILNNFL